jgi:hypothetical protein
MFGTYCNKRNKLSPSYPVLGVYALYCSGYTLVMGNLCQNDAVDFRRIPQFEN